MFTAALEAVTLLARAKGSQNKGALLLIQECMLVVGCNFGLSQLLCNALLGNDELVLGLASSDPSAGSKLINSLSQSHNFKVVEESYCCTCLQSQVPRQKDKSSMENSVCCF